MDSDYKTLNPFYFSSELIQAGNTIVRNPHFTAGTALSS